MDFCCWPRAVTGDPLSADDLKPDVAIKKSTRKIFFFLFPFLLYVVCFP